MRAINDLTVPPVSCVGAGSLIDCGRFVRTPLTREPFEFLVAPGFAPRAAAAADSFPGPDPPGVPPAPWVEPNTGFGRLSHALRSPLVTEAFGAQFGLKLTTDTLMVTPWARTRPRDGTIHTDSETKLATALVYLTLVYLNNHWDNAGRLRLSRGPTDIEDLIAEVPPESGMLIAFRRSCRSWRGHTPFDGVRRAIMLNWMVDVPSARRESRRHAVSAGFGRWPRI